VVSRHVNQALAGLMFDSNLGLPRQGAAIFVDRLNELQGAGAEAARQRLHTVVHEIGHTLNLLHCFQADRSELYRGRARPEALTWMNYPHLYPNGEAQPNLSEWYDESRANYWSHFGYGFDRDELTHLRHGALHTVMIGGGIESFMKQSSRETELLRPSVSSGLELDLVLPDSVDFLQQIEGYARLYNRAPKGRQIHDDLSLSAGTLTIAVGRRGATRFLRHWRISCVPRVAVQALDPGGKVYEPLTLNFGDRWYVDEPGTYDFQAVYQPPDGPPAVSPVRQVRVGRPWSREAERQANDFFCNEVGLYLGLNGSRSDRLKATAESLDDLAQRFAGRSVAAQIRRANHLMATRPLKRPNRPALFDADRARAAAQALDAHLAQAQQGSATSKPLNPHLSCESTAAATGWARVGATDQAHQTLVRLAAFLRNVGAPPQALRIPQNLASQWHLNPIDP
jgi:hypothetical protein